MSRANTALKLIPGTHENTYENKYEAIFQEVFEPILLLTKDLEIESANNAFEELTCYPKDEVIEKNISILFPPKSQLPKHSRALSAELLDLTGLIEDVAICKKDGVVRLVDLSVRRMDSYRILLFRDVTVKKQLERELITKHAELRRAYMDLEKNNSKLKATQEMLIQAGKMTALGELSAGIAHELNQPLQAIRGYAQELQSGSTPEQQKDWLGEIISNSDKMSKIIQHLRAFTRKSAEELELTDVHQAIDEALKMLARQLSSHGITIEKSFAENLPKVYANPLQIEQVFINLATNARDAIEETRRGQGRITIQTSEKDKYIEVIFSDDGAGMNEKTRTKVFNPFFTTKEVGQGMGLGLSISYGILSKIHASIVVESEWGKGTRFILRIPKDYRELNS